MIIYAFIVFLTHAYNQVQKRRLLKHKLTSITAQLIHNPKKINNKFTTS